MNKQKLEQKLERSFQQYKQYKDKPESEEFQLASKWLKMYNISYIVNFRELYQYQEHRGQEQLN